MIGHSRSGSDRIGIEFNWFVIIIDYIKNKEYSLKLSMGTKLPDARHEANDDSSVQQELERMTKVQNFMCIHIYTIYIYI